MKYKIIIPNLEPKQEHCDCRRAYKEALSGICELCWDEKYPTKQETLEEGYERIYNSMDFTEFDFASFKLGTKWQQEQVIQLLKDNDYENEAVFDFLTEEFFNQNKKK